MKPVIGITPNYSYDERKFSLSEHYSDSIQKAGGTPILLFPGEGEIPAFVDGILFSGGGDIDPLLFGEEPLKNNGEICPLRDIFELQLCQKALDENLPVLGICRGMQLLCVIAGGHILQDIESQTQSPLKHMQEAPRFYPTHTIDIMEQTLLSSILGEAAVAVNSFHHQAIADPGRGFLVSAKSRDGLIEAMEHKTKDFVLGVQWHPEAMEGKEQQRIFESFVAACERRRNLK